MSKEIEENLKCSENNHGVTGVIVALKDNIALFTVETSSTTFSKRIKNMLVSFLKSSDADNSSYSFIVKQDGANVVIEGNIHNAISLLSQLNYLDSNLCSQLNDEDEIEIREAIDQSKTVKIQNAYDSSVNDAKKECGTDGSSFTFLTI